MVEADGDLETTLTARVHVDLERGQDEDDGSQGRGPDALAFDAHDWRVAPRDHLEGE